MPEQLSRRLRDLVGRARPAAPASPAAPTRPVPGPVDPSRYGYVVVVTYGRSGSTLLQGLMNALPRTLVRGENGLYVLPLYRAFALVTEFKQLHRKHRPRQVVSAFYGLHEIKGRDFVRSARELVVGHLLGREDPDGYDELGFKEVVWHQVRPEETAGFFDYLDRVLPGVRYVLNERHVDDVVGSGFWQSEVDDDVRAKIRRVEDIQAHLRTSRPDRVLDLRYEDVTSSDPAVSAVALRRLATFVTGSCDDETLQRLVSTLEVGYGPNPFGESRRTRTVAASGES